MPTEKVIPQADRLRRPPSLTPDLSRREAADVLGIGLAKLDQLVRDGALASYKLGAGRRSARRIRRDSLEAFRHGQSGWEPPEAA